MKRCEVERSNTRAASSKNRSDATDQSAAPGSSLDLKDEERDVVRGGSALELRHGALNPLNNPRRVEAHARSDQCREPVLAEEVPIGACFGDSIRVEHE